MLPPLALSGTRRRVLCRCAEWNCCGSSVRLGRQELALALRYTSQRSPWYPEDSAFACSANDFCVLSRLHRNVQQHQQRRLPLAEGQACRGVDRALSAGVLGGRYVGKFWETDMADDRLG